MRAFACPVCRRLVTFESDRCLHCGTELAFDPEPRDLVVADGRRCANAELAACNWTSAADGDGLCASCALTRTRPADRDLEGLEGLRAVEAAKRRLLFELGELELPVRSWREGEGGLAFDLLSSEREPVTTGHADGVITVDLAESDAAERERRRTELHEPYRTVLGHLRHEIGHYYEEVIVPDPSPQRDAVRELFGDDRADYQEALDRHYAEGPPADWHERFVSAYATMHPWEDWAETFAHYLHIRDTLQTAAAYGVRVEGPDVATADEPPLEAEPEAVEEGDVPEMVRSWLPLTYALNAINRSMGAGDLYPFVLGPAVQAKLALVGRLVAATQRLAPAGPPS